MKNTKNFLSAGIAFATLLFVSVNISAAENRQVIFHKVFNNEKVHIMSLPAYTTARNKFNKFLNDIEEYKQILTKEMHNDKEYQDAFAAIKQEIQNAGTKYHQLGVLTQDEANQLVQALTKQFIPQ